MGQPQATQVPQVSCLRYRCTLSNKSSLNLGFQVSLITETQPPLSNWLSQAELPKAHLNGSFPSSFHLFLCNWVIIFNYFWYFSLGVLGLMFTAACTQDNLQGEAFPPVLSRWGPHLLRQVVCSPDWWHPGGCYAQGSFQEEAWNSPQ